MGNPIDDIQKAVEDMEASRNALIAAVPLDQALALSALIAGDGCFHMSPSTWQKVHHQLPRLYPNPAVPTCMASFRGIRVVVHEEMADDEVIVAEPGWKPSGSREGGAGSSGGVDGSAGRDDVVP